MSQNASPKPEAPATHKPEELRFLGLVSHELKTPLNAIIGFSQMMQSELFGKLGAPEYREFADEIQTSGKKLLALIDELIAASSAQLDDFKAAEAHVDLLSLIADVVEAASPLAGQRGLTLEISGDARPAAIWTDPRTVRQALSAIIDNAIKFSPEAGTIAIGLEIDDAGDVIAWVKDQGAGFPDGAFKNMTELFKQADGSVGRSHEGMGVGLFLCHQLMELNGGALEIDNAADGGALVKLRLPRARRVDVNAEDDLTVMDDDDVELAPDVALLEVTHDGQSYHIFSNGSEFVVGRSGARGESAEADLCVADRRASRYHAQIVAADGAFFLVDESRRGTYIAPDGEAPEYIHRSVSQPIVGSGVIALGDTLDADGVATLHYRLRQANAAQ